MASVTDEPTTVATAPARRTLRDRAGVRRESEHEVLADSLLDGRLRLDDEDRLAAFGAASADDPMFATFGAGLGRAAILLILLIPVSMIKWHDHHWAWGLVQVAGGIALGALYRKESRGGHFREDFEKRDDVNFLHHTMYYRTLEGEEGAEGTSIRLGTKPVVITRYEPKERTF